MAKVKSTDPPLCKLCQNRHWGLCPSAVNPKKALTRAMNPRPKKAKGVRHEDDS